MRILIVEDDSLTARSIGRILSSHKFIWDTTDHGEEALEVSRIYEYDLLILDLILPDIDGYEVLKTIRSQHMKIPVLILSGLNGVDDKVRSLAMGADDYMTKPFSQDELVARIYALVRRSQGHMSSIINTGPLCLNIETKTASVNGKKLRLTHTEYSILELLSVRKGITLTKEIFLNHLYGGIDEPDLKIIDVFICKLRKKLQTECGCPFIETIWGRGYILKEPGQDFYFSPRRRSCKTTT